MSEAGTDPLSPLTHEIITAASYDNLVVTATGPRAHELLDGVMPDQLLSVPVVSWPHAAAMLCGLWLWHDALDESHQIAQKAPQDLHASTRYPHAGGPKTSLRVESAGNKAHDLRDATDSLSFWHAIMHRREGDFGNSKYWYARCADHPVLAALAANAAAFLNPLPADKSWLRLTHNGWNAAAFVDLVEAVHRTPNDSRRETVVGLQRLEWRMLFDFCTRQAVGS